MQMHRFLRDTFMYVRLSSIIYCRKIYTIMHKVKWLLICLFIFMASYTRAETPCNFKGVYVGNKTTPAALMKAFGINKYKMNPEIPNIIKLMKLTKLHDPTDAIRTEDYNLGPYCTDKYCKIPFEVGVGNDNTPVSVFVSFPEKLITEIDVTFNQVYWDEIRQILDKKYGSDWNIKHDPNFVITDNETRQYLVFDRIILNHRTNGTNPKTGDTCKIWATNYDIVFTHHDPLGMYQSVFVIKLVSNNF